MRRNPTAIFPRKTRILQPDKNLKAMTEAIVAQQTYAIDVQNGQFYINGEPANLHIAQQDALAWRVAGTDQIHELLIHSVDAHAKTVTLSINGKKTTVQMRSKVEQMLRAMGIESSAKKLDALKAPMPGLIRGIAVKPGDSVKKGDPLLILEAMKMENVIKAAGDGTIDTILVSEGTAVEKGALLIKFS